METKVIELTPEDALQFEEFKKQKQIKEEKDRKIQARETYKDLVDETINKMFPDLEEISSNLNIKKKEVYNAFHEALILKQDIFDIKSDQRSHSFTSKDGTKRIILGQYETDCYDDTVDEGVAKVKEYISSLARDPESKMLVEAIIKLLSKDKQGNLKASKVMQLRKMAEQSQDDSFMDGVRIIEAAHRPTVSKFYIKAEKKNKQGGWTSVPLGMTEA